ncbi:putative integral membrane protein [Streptomyces formicae]|uniref:Putative integral membrane protein n=1 Tax=Streptomyces formicae TaxID=1616117 RepID=A0A291QE02_9ACTN|nr:putative integral membrane protein [Streptomyces formicae]
MSAPSGETFPALGFVPCPGDHDAVDRVADAIRETASALGEVKRVLKGADDGEWRGKAAIAFRELLDEDFRPRIDDAFDSFDGAKDVARGWADYMRDKQKAARALEREAAEVQRAVDKAKDETSDATDPLEEVRKRARTLHSTYEEEGKSAAGRLKKAIGIAPNEPGFWENLGGTIGDWLDGFGDFLATLHDLTIEYLGRLAPLLDLIGDIAGLLSALTGLMAFVPGLQFLAAASLFLSGTALAAHYLSAVGTTGSFGKAALTKDVIMDAAGFGLAKVGSKIGDDVLATVRSSGAPTRVARQFIGPDKEVPHGFFHLAMEGSVGAGTRGYAMSQSEMSSRTAGFFMTWTGNVMTAEGGGDTLETVGKIAAWDFGPTTQQPKVIG